MTIRQTPKFPEATKSIPKKGAPPTVTNLDKPLEIQDIKSESADICRALQQAFKRKVQNARKNPVKFGKVQLEEIIGEIDTEIKKNKFLEHSGAKVSMNGRQILTQLADLKNATHQTNDDAVLLSAMQADLEGLLPTILDRELYHWFLAEMVKLKNDLEILKTGAHESEIVFRKENEDLTIRERVAAMKGCDIAALRGDVMKSLQVCGTVPKHVRELLFHPVWLSRKFEKEFSVALDKSADGACVSGSAKDVDACVLKLENLDVSGKKTLILDGRTIATILGPGGSNAYQLERDCDVLLYAPAGSVELTLFGSEKSVEKALKLLGPLKELVSSSGLITERLNCLTCIAKALDTDTIQVTCGVTLTLGPDDEHPASSWLTVRGPNECLSNAMHAINTQMDAMLVDHISAPGAELLFASAGPRNGFAEVKLQIRWNELKKRAAFVQPVPNGPVDVATRENNLDEILSEFLEIVKRVQWVTHKVELERDHSRCWNEAMCALVGNKVLQGGEIACRRSTNAFGLEIWADPQCLPHAARLIDQVHAARILPVPEECAKPMLENKCQVLQSMQTEATVSCHFDRFENSLFLYGLEENKQQAAHMFDDFVDSVRQALLQSTIKTIAIAVEEIGRLIGPKGRIMNSIRDRAGIEEIRISEQERKVYLVGPALGIDHAISLIEEELSAKKDATVVQIGLAEDEETSLELQQGKQVDKNVARARVDQWTKLPSESIQTPVAIDSNELFPALGSLKRNVMSWRSKGSSDQIRRGQAFRTVAHDNYEIFPSKFLDRVVTSDELGDVSRSLVNQQRVLVNYLLYPGSDISFRVHLSNHTSSLWKRLANEVGEAYYPAELLSDSRSTVLGLAKKPRVTVVAKKSLTELENQDKDGEEEEEEEDADVQSESSVGADDYNVKLDFEDEGARDDYDEGDAGGDYGGEF